MKFSSHADVKPCEVLEALLALGNLLLQRLKDLRRLLALLRLCEFSQLGGFALQSDEASLQGLLFI